MSFSLAPLCLAGLLLAAPEDPAQRAVEVRRFSFESSDDLDFDGQPDDWTRRAGLGFPRYVRTEIDRTAGRAGQQSLRMTANGGRAAMYSPPTAVRVDAQHAYLVRGWIRTSGLKHDAALLSASLLNVRRQRLSRHLSAAVSGTHAEWVQVEIGPLFPSPETRYLILGCHLVHDGEMDIHGHAWFDDLWVGSLPRMSLSLDAPARFYRVDQPIQVSADVQGLDPRHSYQLQLQLLGGSGEAPVRTFPLKPIAPPPPVPGALPVERDDVPAAREPLGWTIPPLPLGSYVVSARLERDGEMFVEKQDAFAVVEPLAPPAAGEFGWSLAQRPPPASLELLSDVALQAGVRWVKVPVWSFADPRLDAQATHLTRVFERLDRRGVTIVGLLNDPPDQLAQKFAYNWVGVSKVFSLAPEVWYPSLEPVIARYSFHIRHWQLGQEQDDSFVGLPTLPQTLRAVKQEFDRIGRDVHLGLHWAWEQDVPPEVSQDHAFWSLAAGDKSDEELIAALQRPGRPPNCWVLLRPLSRAQGTPDERAADLARKMTAAKIGGAEAIFLDDPYHPEHGVLFPHGAPNELFLPWRTVAAHLRGLRFQGRLTLEHESRNAVFEGPGQCTIVLWRDQPGREVLYLGPAVQACDLWGRPVPLTMNPETGEQSVEVGPLPILIRDAQPALVRWQLDAGFLKGKVPSEYGGHPDAVVGTNPFPQGVSGTVALQLPRDWKVEPAEWGLQVAANEPFQLPLTLSFPPDSSLGEVRARIRFDVIADRPYKFTIHRRYQVGLGEVTLAAVSRRLPDGRLEIEQKIVNQTDPLEVLNFHCSLFVPGSKRQRQNVIKLGKGVDTKIYYVPHAADLVGRELWIRAEQVDGNRVLNYKWNVTQ